MNILHDNQIFDEADRTGRTEARLACPHCAKRASDQTLCVNTRKRTGVCHRCGYKVSGHQSEHFAYQYVDELALARERKAKQRVTEDRADRAVRLATLAPACHPYLIRKRIQPHGIGVLGERYRDLPSIVRNKGNVLVIPMQDVRGKVLSCQFIAEDGSKGYCVGPKEAGGFFLLSGKDRIWIVEGFATGASLHEDTGDTVFVAFDANGLLPVTRAIKKLCPRREIIILADDDWKTPGNPGLTKAAAVSLACNVPYTIPKFDGLDRGTSDTDYNDLRRLQREI